MERKVQLAEQAATVKHSSQQNDFEKEELRKKLEEARLAEKVAKIQLFEATSGDVGEVPKLPPTTVAMTVSTDTPTSSNHTITTAVVSTICLRIMHCHGDRFLEKVCNRFVFLSKVPPSGASVDVLTARPLSPDQWSGSPDQWAESPHAELEFGPDGDIEDLTKQLEKERLKLFNTVTY